MKLPMTGMSRLRKAVFPMYEIEYDAACEVDRLLGEIKRKEVPPDQLSVRFVIQSPLKPNVQDIEFRRTATGVWE